MLSISVRYHADINLSIFHRGLQMSLVIENTITVKHPHTYLGEVMSDLPDNTYLCKGITGCGATSLALTNDVPYIVIVPYISAIDNKTEQVENSHVKGVKGGVTIEDIVEHITSMIDKGERLKLMTTYDSFFKCYEALDRLGMVQDFKLCIDEAHVLVSLAKIKGICFSYLYKHFRLFKSYVFITATPNDKSLLPSAIQDVDFVRVVWEAAEKVEITEQRVKSVRECNKVVVEICVSHLLGEVDGNAYIFYNSVSEIIAVIKKLKNLEDFTSDNVNIFCANNPYNEKRLNAQLGKEFGGGSFDDCKKINFLTSGHYESCDINDMEGKSYIIVSSKRNSTALTNHICVTQIVGRLRKSEYKNEAVMIIAGFEEDVYQQPLNDFKNTLDKMESEAQYQIDRANKAKEDGFESTYLQDLDSFSTNPFVIVNTDGTLEINSGARLSELQTHQAFNSYMVTVPRDVQNSTVRVVDNNKIEVSDLARLLVDEKVDFSRMMNEYIKSIEEDDLGTTEMIEQKSNLHKEYVDVLGIDRIKSLGSNKTKLTNAYNLAIKFSDNNLEIKSRLSSLRVGKKYTSTDIVNLLQSCYDDLNIDRKAVSNDIKNYFIVSKTQVVSEVDGKRKQGFKIVSDLYK